MLFSTQDLKYSHPGQPQFSFSDISLDKGDSLLVLGKSGSGKTTLLNLLGGLLKPQSGTVILGTADLTKMDGAKLDLFRGKNIGIVFQKPHLLAPLSVKENLVAAQYFAKEKGQNVQSLLDELGIGAKANSSVKTLSEGEAQRVSIARALVNKPQLILADEPTSSLDDENTEKVINLLKNQAEKIGAALIIVTHDQRVKDHISNFIEVKAT
ncbi:ABC transporter ATP-binding protein [Algoriphagus zhangzhouensis]|uniref:Putative ABC transport system ATP-binding protein n=1 Tax=Algoriphagus zhangzhouensis TaxID=1073327 RepID=A0A1M7ZK30_9BACT|nr:ATP-binding cassette domain-containing protein [Algoriphagus zhangzhouensis]TDY43143.1 putative ABC transport system ATP-binding protein [Algoriphagus zhangzhouensis]SHO65270.1 putative ABC transport system ATP-binding protein [Algoriphagus zhangzhouensis]